MCSERVVIIGGGVTAALSAVRLCERGFDVTVVEKASIANGSSRRSAASIRAQFTVEATVAGMMFAEWYYSNFHDMMKTMTEPEPVIRPNGYLFLFERPEAAGPPWELARRRSAEAAWVTACKNVEMQREVGLPVELLEPSEIERRWPHLVGDRLVGATWCPQDGFLRPDIIYGRGFARAQELGANILTNTEVVGARIGGGRLSGIDTTAGLIEGDWFVNATNAWAARVSRLLGGMPLPIDPTKRYLYMMTPRPGSPDLLDWDQLPMTIFGGGDGRGAIARPVFGRPDGARLQTGWAHAADPDTRFTDSDQDLVERGFHHSEGETSYAHAVLRQIEDFTPTMAHSLDIVATECGYYGITPDHTPIIGVDLNQDNLVHAAGCSGHGLMHAPFTAALVEGLVAGDANTTSRLRLPPPYHKHEIDLARFAPSRSFADSEGLVL